MHVVNQLKSIRNEVLQTNKNLSFRHLNHYYKGTKKSIPCPIVHILIFRNSVK